MNCILCHSNKLTTVEKIAVKDLIKVYNSLTAGYTLSNEFRDIRSIDLIQCNECDFLFYSPQISGSAEFYEFLQNFDWYYRTTKPEYDFAKQYINKADDVLEIGAGVGHFAKGLVCNQYIGLEYNDTSIVLAKENGITLIKESIEAYSTKNPNTYNVVCAFQVLEHIPDPRQFIESCIKALKTNGKLIFSIPSADSYAARFPNHTLNLPPHHVSLWTDNTLKNIAKLFNLNILVIYHENCDKDQFKWFLYSIFINRINRFLKLKTSLVEAGLLYKIKNKIVMRLAAFFTPADVNIYTARGQSVTVIYEKK